VPSKQDKSSDQSGENWDCVHMIFSCLLHVLFLLVGGYYSILLDIKLRGAALLRRPPQLLD
jgi:hypothetical protein